VDRIELARVMSVVGCCEHGDEIEFGKKPGIRPAESLSAFQHLVLIIVVHYYHHHLYAGYLYSYF
jgi:hypothetical protein